MQVSEFILINNIVLQKRKYVYCIFIVNFIVTSHAVIEIYAIFNSIRFCVLLRDFFYIGDPIMCFVVHDWFKLHRNSWLI